MSKSINITKIPIFHFTKLPLLSKPFWSVEKKVNSFKTFEHLNKTVKIQTSLDKKNITGIATFQYNDNYYDVYVNSNLQVHGKINNHS